MSRLRRGGACVLPAACPGTPWVRVHVRARRLRWPGVFASPQHLLCGYVSRMVLGTGTGVAVTPGRQARPRRDIPELGHTGLRQGRCPSPGAVLARHMAPKAHAPVSAACRRLGHSDQPPIAMPRVQRPFQVPGKLHAPIPVLSLPCPSLRFPAQAACDEGLCPVCHLCPLSGEEALTRPQLLSAPVSHGHGPWRQTTGSRWSRSPTSWVASSGAPPLSLRLLTESRGHSRTHPMGCREVLSWRPGRRVIVGCGVCRS